MICKGCKNEIDDDSHYCKFCGRQQIKPRRKSREITVPRPKQLPSGSWTIYLGPEKQSVTESTARKCEEKALLIRRTFLAKKTLGLTESSLPILTLGDAIDRFVTNRSEFLSPSTQRSYWSMRKHRMQQCMDWNIFEPTNNWQGAVNQELIDGLSAKTVKNVWRLCSGAIRSAGGIVPSVDLKRSTPAEHKWLSYDQIDPFLDAIKGHDCELGAILALHSLRLSELLALKPSNISWKSKELLIRGSRVLNSDGLLIYKELNKTERSRREVPFFVPRLEELLKAVPKDSEWVVDMNGKRLYDQINRICRANGLPEVGVHGLRHSFASLLYHLGRKELSVMQIGGWSDSTVVREIYTHNSDLATDIQAVRDFFNHEKRNVVETDSSNPHE